MRKFRFPDEKLYTEYKDPVDILRAWQYEFMGADSLTLKEFRTMISDHMRFCYQLRKDFIRDKDSKNSSNFTITRLIGDDTELEKMSNAEFVDELISIGAVEVK